MQICTRQGRGKGWNEPRVGRELKSSATWTTRETLFEVGRLLGEVGARGKQKLVVVDLSQGRKSRRYSRGKPDRAQVQEDLAEAPNIFFVKAVSVQWRHA
jgi:hypothetical protein